MTKITPFTITASLHRGAFCQFPFRWIYYCHSSKFTGKETGKTHLWAFLKLHHWQRLQLFGLIWSYLTQPDSSWSNMNQFDPFFLWNTKFFEIQVHFLAPHQSFFFWITRKTLWSNMFTGFNVGFSIQAPTAVALESFPFPVSIWSYLILFDLFWPNLILSNPS